ncbi:AAA family ATPase (plasmid) [Streptosporangium sp. NBC_01495]|uniref:AAA family ATPase n=1 Tax=Streptosporangium sp. NBC_01495 TaxID=2903899 RepID=UPI002E327FD3|nr:AAA family ATPase [Streptosporangium sp. NBC_01495]
MATLYITCGLPGSGKTTLADAWVGEAPARRARVNQGDLRAMLHNSVHLGPETAVHVRAARDVLITTLLAAGLDVICDDTNLMKSTINDLVALAAAEGARVEFHDLRNVPVEECIRRDAARARPVGEAVIRSMDAQLLQEWPSRREPL